MKPLISIIIPTYKRIDYLIKLLSNLKQNFKNFKNFEIIICDSDKTNINKLRINSFVRNIRSLKIKYFNIRENNHSKKRNLGIKKASSNLLIFLDDDCFPEEYFVKKYYRILRENKDKAIFCGSVLYPLSKNNFLRYRQQLHFKVSNSIKVIQKEEISADKVVTMNMAFNLNKIDKKNLFNEKFNFYGFEDYDFAYRQIKSGIKIYKSSPIVIHYDLRSYEKYLYKMVFLGNYGMKYLLKLNREASERINYFYLENNLIIKQILKIKNIVKLFKILIFLMIYIEKKIISLAIFIKLGIVFAYLTGCLLRKDINKKDKFISNNWYV